MNPLLTRAVAGLQGDGSKGVAIECGGASQPDEKCLAPAPYRTLIDRLAAAVRALLDAGPPQLPGSLQIDLTVLLTSSRNDATRTLQAAKQESARVGCTNAAEAEGVERGAS